MLDSENTPDARIFMESKTGVLDIYQWALSDLISKIYSKNTKSYDKMNHTNLTILDIKIICIATVRNLKFQIWIIYCMLALSWSPGFSNIIFVK